MSIADGFEGRFLGVLITAWLWFGYRLIYSHPQGWRRIKSWFLWAFLVVGIIFTILVLLTVFTRTATKIPLQDPAFLQSSADGGRTVPKSGTDRAGDYADQLVTNCNGQSEGTKCIVARRAGTCTRSDSSESDGRFSCYVTLGSVR